MGARRRRGGPRVVQHPFRGLVHPVAGGAVDRGHGRRGPACRVAHRAGAVPGRSLFVAALIVPFVLPTVVVGTAFLAVLGPDGPLAAAGRLVGAELDLRRTATAIVIAHVFFNYAVVARTVGSAWMGVDPSAEAAARTLGADRWTAFRAVTLPQLRPALAGAASIVFLFTFTSFGVVKILGGPRIATIEVEIHRLTTQLLDLRTASVLSLLQLAAVVAALALHRRAGARRGRADLRAGRSVLRRAGGRRAVAGGVDARRRGAAHRRPDRHPRVALLRHRRRSRAGVLPSARRVGAGERPLRAAARGRPQLPRVRCGGRGDRPRGRRSGRRRAAPPRRPGPRRRRLLTDAAPRRRAR